VRFPLLHVQHILIAFVAARLESAARAVQRRIAMRRWVWATVIPDDYRDATEVQSLPGTVRINALALHIPQPTARCPHNAARMYAARPSMRRLVPRER
jgi:hypothetical protein